MESVTYSSLYRFALSSLSGISESPSHEAVLIFKHCFGIDRLGIVIKGEEAVNAERLPYFYECIEKRKHHTPIQYILGQWTFCDNTFAVGEGVLIPRPETEMLVSLAVQHLEKTDKASPVIFDLCSGSGCIGISVAKRFKDAKVYAFEKSKTAIGYIEKNILLNGTDNVKLIEYDILDGFDKDKFPMPDVLLSNPPYIPKNDLPSLSDDVKKEPKMALDGGSDGLSFYRCIRDKWLCRFNIPTFFCLEFGIGQSEDIKKIFSDVTHDLAVFKDFNGIDRTASAVLNKQHIF